MKRADYLLEDAGLCDLVPLYCGYQECEPGHSSDGVRDYWMIHYVFSGYGTLAIGGKTYAPKGGDAFLIPPGTRHRYAADLADPWTYGWICFRGNGADVLRAVPPSFPYPDDTFTRVRESVQSGHPDPYFVTGCLFEICSRLLGKEKIAKDGGYAERARDMIDRFYMLPIDIGQIAKKIGIDRRYLPRLFRARYGTCPEEYLVGVRMEHAAAYLRQGRNAAEAGRLSGYADPVNFYRMFKRHFGIGPRAYREQETDP